MLTWFNFFLLVLSLLFSPNDHFDNKLRAPPFSPMKTFSAAKYDKSNRINRNIQSERKITANTNLFS